MAGLEALGAEILVMDWQGMAGEAMLSECRLVGVRRGRSSIGNARQAWRGVARRSIAAVGNVGRGRPCEAGPAGLVVDGHGSGWRGRIGRAAHVVAGQRAARAAQRPAKQAWLGRELVGNARRGDAGRAAICSARQGSARLCADWRWLARQAGQGPGKKGWSGLGSVRQARHCRAQN